MCLREIGCKDVGWIYLAFDSDQWQAHVNMVMNLQVQLQVGSSLTS
jgi:hypothetical protein